MGSGGFAVLALTLIAWTGPGYAADPVGVERGDRRTTAYDRERSLAIVVPDCEERFGARLLGCERRDVVDWPNDLALQQIEQTMTRPRRLPYPQLLDRP